MPNSSLYTDLLKNNPVFTALHDNKKTKSFEKLGPEFDMYDILLNAFHVFLLLALKSDSMESIIEFKYLKLSQLISQLLRKFDNYCHWEKSNYRNNPFSLPGN